MAEVDVHGPVDFVLIEFTGNRLTGRAAEEIMNLEDRGIIHVYDILVAGKDQDGNAYAVDLEEAADTVGGFTDFQGARSGILADDDLRQAADAMEPGTLAVLIVYENLWARPFVAAAREAGGEMIAAGRIPAADVMEALDTKETKETAEATS